MSITQTLIAIGQHQIDLEEGFRELLAQPGWLVPTKHGASSARDMATNVANTRSAWIMSGPEQYEAACRLYSKEAIGPVMSAEHLEDVIAELPDELWILRIEPGGPVSVPLQGEDLETFRRVARGVRIERAIVERRFSEVRAHNGFIVAYDATPGQRPQMIALGTDRGPMIAAFTTEGAAQRFRASIPPEELGSVGFTVCDGGVLFGEAAPAVAQGVVVNGKGPNSMKLDLAACRAVAEAE